MTGYLLADLWSVVEDYLLLLATVLVQSLEYPMVVHLDSLLVNLLGLYLDCLLVQMKGHYLVFEMESLMALQWVFETVFDWG